MPRYGELRQEKTMFCNVVTLCFSSQLVLCLFSNSPNPPFFCAISSFPSSGSQSINRAKFAHQPLSIYTSPFSTSSLPDCNVLTSSPAVFDSLFGPCFACLGLWIPDCPFGFLTVPSRICLRVFDLLVLTLPVF